MKNLHLIGAVFTACILMTSCGKDEAYTENPTFIPEATGDNAKQLEKDQRNNGGNNGGGSANQLPSDFLAPTVKSNRAALLEDFTGVRCGFCPDGHEKAKSAKASLGADNLIILAVHGGSYAQPANGWANFTTAFGQELIDQALVSGYPAGTISRIKADSLGVTPQLANGYAMSRSSWFSAASQVVSKSSPVNIGATATIDGSNSLVVKVDLYYTATETAINHINVALVQDGLMSKQSGAPDPDNYAQDNVLRHFITGQWGDEVMMTTKDSSNYYRKTYNYTVPTDYNGLGTEGGGAVVINDLKVVVFVTRGRTDVVDVIEVDVQ